MNDERTSNRVLRAPRGTALNCRSWLTEAAYRMLHNNLDPDVAERPEELVVYGGIGRAARNWTCFDQISDALKVLGDDESLLIQSGSPLAFSRPPRCTQSADRELQPGPQVGDLGALQRTG